MKHQKPVTTHAPTPVTIEQLLALETDVVDMNLPLGRGTDMNKEQRDKLHDLQAGTHHFGEGDYVQLVGFITDDDKNPRFNKGESVYCYLPEKENNDIHINIVDDPENDELDGIVVEMMPYNRPAEWNLTKLRAVRRAGRQVLIRGALFLDNVHLPHTDCEDTNNEQGKRVCIDRDEPAAGNPARASLWEIHPVTEFYVCMTAKNSCSPAHIEQWVTLKDVSLARLKALAQ